MHCTAITAYDERLTPSVWSYPNITRPFSILYYVLGGRGFYTFEGEEHPFEEGHLYILPANRTFSLREDQRDKFYAVYIHAFTSPEINRVIDVNVRKDEFLMDTIALIRRYIKKEDPLYLQSLTDLLLSYLARTGRIARGRLPEEIKAYIDDHYVAVYKNSDLSPRFNYSRLHLSRVFKEKYNLTPRQYAQQLLLKEAVLLLRSGCSVTEIAERLEFSSPENLCRFFKSCYGVSPTQYAKSFKDFTV